MALDMDPERRRKLMELARLQDEWQERHQLDDVEFTPDGADGDQRRTPTLEQQWEYERRAREILGQDPDTGLYRD
ncbi:hypothetical protein GCM10027290_66620 [Micromonospora sonneratiae]|uniref:Uncharacterized protein n=1 Tax=Micromonospora sonneratiae TaxID=1184706 RepID=A0ABW3YME8_9ACTN